MDKYKAFYLYIKKIKKKKESEGEQWVSICW